MNIHTQENSLALDVLIMNLFNTIMLRNTENDELEMTQDNSLQLLSGNDRLNLMLLIKNTIDETNFSFKIVKELVNLYDKISDNNSKYIDIIILIGKLRVFQHSKLN